MLEASRTSSSLVPIAVKAGIATLCAVALSWGVNYLMLLDESISPFTRSAITVTLIPILVAAPLAAVIFWQHSALRAARRANNASASRDPGTGHFDQNILAIAVEERRRHVDLAKPARGAFLMLEVNELRTINAEYGPDWSASAISLVAQTIRRSVRAGDLVGRLETGEFGIFLPHTNEEDAERVGARIVQAIESAYFAPNGVETTVHARVAAIVFENELEFPEMVRLAASQLAASPDTVANKH